MEQDIIIKICIVGQPGVGKTSMLYQYAFKKFDPNTRPTIGCDFSTKLKSTKDNKTIRLQLWDIAGQQRFNAVSKMYIRGALGCIIVCSAQQRKTVQETLKWKKIIDQNCDHAQNQNEPIPSLLVMNKSDLINSNDCQEFQKMSFLQQFGKNNNFCGVLSTSAKDNKNIEECFQTLLDEIINRGLIADLKTNKNDDTVNLVTKPTKSSKKKCC